MPRIKIDYVVSFSSEDSDNRADSLLNWEVSKKKWLCVRGEPTSSVVLQLKSCTQISAVHIGAYHAALVEVLVGLSEKPNNPYEVLVPSSVFVNPIESRRNEGLERVRSFTTEQLCEATRSKRWDRVRIVCSQPYNKHCQYGLSFIHIYSPDETNAGTLPSADTSCALTVPNYSSDEEEFKPGELFAMHRQSQGESSNTGSQIRQASSQAIKNISDSATKLVKTPISKQNLRTSSHKDENPKRDRDRSTLIYTDDDEQPHAKIDRIVQRHNDEKKDTSKAKENEKTDKNRERHKTDAKRNERDSNSDKHKGDKNERDGKIDKHKSDKDEIRSKTSENKNIASTSRDTPTTSRRKDDDKNNLKRTHSERKESSKELRPSPKSSTPQTLLENVVFAISGYENPRRANIRSTALAMGASYRQNWTPECTHLICAFPNTPKLKSVRADPQGAACIVVTGEWVEQCSQHMRVLPWQWFATEVGKRVKRNWSGSEEEEGDDDFDTDDEIERVVQQQKKRKTDRNESRTSNESQRNDISQNDIRQNDKVQNKVKKNGNLRNDISENNANGDGMSGNDDDDDHISAVNISRESDVTFVKDERIQGNLTIQDTDSESEKTDEDISMAQSVQLDPTKLLPDLFDGAKFYVDDVFSGDDKELIERYVTAYGGLVLKDSQLDPDLEIDYLISTTIPDGVRALRCVKVDWLWRCHKEQTLCDVAEYML